MPPLFDRYTYQIHWSEEDQEYVGTCVEFPSMSVLWLTPEDALYYIRKLVCRTVSDMQQHGEPPPVVERDRRLGEAQASQDPPIVE